MDKNGNITIIGGCMFSGKSSELLRRMNRYKYVTTDIVLFKWKKDCRYSEEYVSTHDKYIVKDIMTIPCESIIEGLKFYKNQTGKEYPKVLGIDEGQFFSDIMLIDDLSNIHNIIIIVAMLDGNYKRVPFKGTEGIFSIADTYVKLRAICIKCKKKAAFTKRIVENTEEILIGGEEDYQPVCRKCY